MPGMFTEEVDKIVELLEEIIERKIEEAEKDYDEECDMRSRSVFNMKQELKENMLCIFQHLL